MKKYQKNIIIKVVQRFYTLLVLKNTFNKFFKNIPN